VLLARPRQILRGWMAALLVPPVFLGLMWFGITCEWGWVRSDLGWSESALGAGLTVAVLAAAAGLYLLLLRSYHDRSALQRRVLSAALALPLAAMVVTSAFIIAVRLLT
jgi:hypothetical protein